MPLNSPIAILARDFIKGMLANPTVTFDTNNEELCKDAIDLAEVFLDALRARQEERTE